MPPLAITPWAVSGPLKLPKDIVDRLARESRPLSGGRRCVRSSSATHSIESSSPEELGVYLKEQVDL
jgi:hypothetical protein